MKKIMKKKVVKKNTHKNKTKESKISKKKPVLAAAGADQDIVGLLTVLVQKLTSFESKIDTVLTRISAQPTALPKPQLPPVIPPTLNPVNKNRPMYKAVCADCALSCEVPFKSREGRQVYCKKCFIARKNKTIFKSKETDNPKQIIPVKKVITVPVKKTKTLKTVKSPKKSTKKSPVKKKSTTKKKKAKR